MTAKLLTPATRYDAVEYNDVERMIESEAFKLVQARIVGDLTRARHTCVYGNKKLQVNRAQGAAQALEAVLTIPSRVLEELKKK